MVWPFKTPKEKYNQLFAELQSIIANINALQHGAWADLGRHDIKGLARAGGQARKAMPLILKARALVNKIRTLCEKQRWPVPEPVKEMAKMLNTEGRREAGLQRTERRFGVKI